MSVASERKQTQRILQFDANLRVGKVCFRAIALIASGTLMLQSIFIFLNFRTQFIGDDFCN